MAASSYPMECPPFLPAQASRTVKPQAFFQNCRLYGETAVVMVSVEVGAVLKIGGTTRQVASPAPVGGASGRLIR